MLGISPADFQDANLNHPKDAPGIAKAHVKFSRFLPKFKKAQQWLGRRVVEDMIPYVPIKTGRLRQSIKSTNKAFEGTGKIVVYTPPYGRWLYNGIYYGPDGARPIHYTNPLSTPHWYDTVRNNYQAEWVQGCKDIIKGKENG